MPDIKCSHSAVWPISQLKPNPRNPNKHSAEQLRLLAKVITVAGWRSPIVVSRRSGLVVKGHGRLEAAKLAGITEAPVDEQDYTDEASEMADMIADNRLAELAEMDLPGLKDLLQEMDTGATDMELAGFSEDALAELMSQFSPEGEADAEAQVDKAEELNKTWQVKTGDLWRIGNHRLLCGDSTKKEDVARVLAGSVPLLMVTDPPYGVEYDPEWRNRAARNSHGMGNRCIGTGAVGKVTNDDQADWSAAWLLFEGDVAYVYHGGIKTGVVQASLENSGLIARSQIIWAKQHMVIGRGDYHWQHEPCWYCVREGKTGHRNEDRTQTTLWKIDKPQSSETGHSTQKPLDCMARPIRNHKAEDVYDPFLGSGTTMVACENLHRKCYGIEIAPGYCAVILQRMTDAFPGIKIERIDGNG